VDPGIRMELLITERERGGSRDQHGSFLRIPSSAVEPTT